MEPKKGRKAVVSSEVFAVIEVEGRSIVHVHVEAAHWNEKHNQIDRQDGRKELEI